MPSMPFPKCCYMVAYKGSARVYAYRVHTSMKEALSSEGRNAQWIHSSQSRTYQILRFEGATQNLPGKPDILQFTHVGDSSCKSTRAYTSIGWNPKQL